MSSLNVFSLILAIGTSFGLLWIIAAAPVVQRVRWLLAAWGTLILALIGSRTGFVLEHLQYFGSHTSEIFQFWLGGLTWEGALAGGLIALPLIAKIYQWPIRLVSDTLSRLVLPLSVAGWVACWWSGLGYGVPLADGTWWGLAVHDETGLVSLRTPVQPLAILSLIVFLGVLELGLNRSEKPGIRGAATLFIFGADMLLLSFMRADPAPAWLGLRFESWLAMVYTLLGLLGTIIYLIKNSFFLWLQRLKRQESKPL
jgi:prolipoprotein diacylglyceryltransferase